MELFQEAQPEAQQVSQTPPPHTAPQPSIEEREKELDLAQSLSKEFREDFYTSCLLSLSKTKTVTQPELIKALGEILMPPKRRSKRFRRDAHLLAEIQQKVLRLLIASPNPEAIPPLVSALFHKAPQIAHPAEKALRAKGSSIVPSLLAVLMQPSPVPYWSEEGTFSILSLLQDCGDSRASHTLIRVAQQELPIKSDLLVTTPFYIASILTSIFMIPAGIIALSMGEGIATLLLGICVWIMAYFTMTLFVFLPLLFFMVPVAVAQERSLQKRFSVSALRALKKIKDKRMLPYLIRIIWQIPTRTNMEAFAALTPLLPLVTKEDASLFTFPHDEEMLSNALDKHGHDTTLNILHVLDCIGGEPSLHRLQRTARRSRSAEVRARASAVYETVKARIALQKEKQVLLRASEAPEDTKDLLRPAKDSPQEDSLLLHPVLSPNEEKS